MRKLAVALFACVTYSVFYCHGAAAQTPLPIASGGTGASTANTAIANLGLPVVSVMNFGAKGDGSTNDTPAINAAMTFCVTPRGGFRTTDVLCIFLQESI
jgi:hypothetical protein